MLVDMGLPPLLAQAGPWLPTWVTPVWILAAGLAAGLILAALILGVYIGLSKIPFLGNLAEDRRRGHLVAAGLSLVVGLGLSYAIVSGIEDANRAYAVTPLMVVGAILGWSFVFGVWRRTAGELTTILSEGVFGYSLMVIGGAAVLGLLATPLVQQPMRILASVPEVFTSGESVVPVEVPGAPLDSTGDAAPFVRLDVEYDPYRSSEVTISSNRSIIIADAETPDAFAMTPTRIEPDEPLTWKADSKLPPPIPADPQRGIYVQNREIDPADVSFRFVTHPQVPQAATIPITGGLVVLFVLAAVALRQAAPRVSAIGLATSKSEIAQPLFSLLLALGAVAIIMFLFIPFNTFGEDIKVLKDSGLTLIMVFGIIQAVWAASTGISEEIEGRTALTVLSKPVSRRSFMLGKFLGISWTVFLLFLVLGLLLLVLVAYKPIYDAREVAADRPDWPICHLEMVTTLPGLSLLFMETMLLAGISTAIATRVPMLANFVICFTIYILGNLTAPIVQSSAENFEIVRFVGRLIAVVVPNLDSFNIQAAVDAGNPIPVLYLAAAFTYLACFGVVVLMIGLLLFEDRDLA